MLWVSSLELGKSSGNGVDPFVLLLSTQLLWWDLSEDYTTNLYSPSWF